MQLRSEKLRKYVNDILLPSLNIPSEIGETTAISWLKKIGFKIRRVRKGVFVDGHEREDVVKARNEFLEYMENHVFP